MLNTKIMENYNRKILFKFRKLAKSKGFNTTSYDRCVLIFNDHNIVIVAGKMERFTVRKKGVYADIEVNFPANSVSALILKLVKFKIFNEYVIRQLLE